MKIQAAITGDITLADGVVLGDASAITVAGIVTAEGDVTMKWGAVQAENFTVNGNLVINGFDLPVEDEKHFLYAGDITCGSVTINGYNVAEKLLFIDGVMYDVAFDGGISLTVSNEQYVEFAGTLENIIIKAQHNCFSDNTQYSGKFIPILHEYVMIVRKDSPLLVPVIVAKEMQVDTRDMAGATWRDVVAAVLEECTEAVTLTYIYEQIEPHKKAQNNKHWREKIRQTLQINPNHFHNTERGMWVLRRKEA